MFRFLLFVFFSHIVVGSTYSQEFHETLRWENAQESAKKELAKTTSEAHYLRFEGAFYPDAETMVPFFYKTYPISNAITRREELIVSYQLDQYEDLTSFEMGGLGERGLDMLPEPTYEVFGNRGQSTLVITLPAIRRNATTGRIQKLQSFSFSISEAPARSKTLPAQRAATESVLQQGNWYKVAVTQSGIHRITYAELQSMGLQNLQNVSIWGLGGRQLPLWNDQPAPDDLKQIPIWIEMGSDGTFGPGDYILFFAEGAKLWDYNPEIGVFTQSAHEHSARISYFVTTSQPNPIRVRQQTAQTAPPNRFSSSFDALVHFEQNDTNLIKSGRQWFGESFDVYTSRNFNTGLTSPVPGDTVKVSVQTAARSGVASSYTLRLNGSSMGTIPHTPVNLSNDYSNFVSIAQKVFKAILPQGEVKLQLEFNKPTPSAKGWLDYITVNARQRLRVEAQQVSFRDLRTVAPNGVTEFSIETTASGLVVWDVTNLFDPIAMLLESVSGGYLFKGATETIREFVAFRHTEAFSIEMVGPVPNQNIHAQPNVPMVIVTHPNFLLQAQELAQIHEEHNGMQSLVVTTDEVYNEFSGGNIDVSAIRNMMRMFYQRSLGEEDMPKYLLLFGDGSYDNLTQDFTRNTNYIPTFQSANSIAKGTSFVTDDFFVLLDDNEGEATGLMDAGVGRIPASSRADANAAVAKVRNYLSPASIGSWHNMLSFIADDQDGNEHMKQADELARFVENNYPRYNVEKIYLDAYPQVTTGEGHRYPGATDAINNRANLGALIMNYTGHANTRWLAHEKILMVSDVQSWRNFDRLPLFVTATCEYSRFDDFIFKSAGEHVLFTPRGGAVALLSTVRVVYSYPNAVLNYNFFQNVFSRNPLELDTPWGGFYTLGEVLRQTKNMTGGDNKRSFILLGDPALRLHYPLGQMAINEINSNPISPQLDTLKALNRVEVKGTVLGSRNANLESGEAQLILFDKVRNVTTLSNDGGVPFNFQTRENVIYKGRPKISNGQFSAEFIVPKDINYSFGRGRFSLYASGDMQTASGFFEDFIVGGIGSNANNDEEGPSIQIFMNDTKFVSGGITDSNPILVVHLVDSSGINTTGIGIGHDLTGTITGASSRTLVLNEHYQANVDDYRSGKVEYQLLNLEKGEHTVRIKAWDVFNNSSEAEIDFIVRSDEKLELSHVLNYPNPFTSTTAFYFEHNYPFEGMDVSIQIFSPSGKLVKTINHTQVASDGYRVGPIPWDGLDDFGDRIGRGVYFYRLRIRLNSGLQAEAYEKLVILK